MSMKSLNHNKLHEATNFLAGVASNCVDRDSAINFIEQARDWYEGEHARLEADNERLRKLMKDAEFPAAGNGNHMCPYCNAYFYEMLPGALHAVDCPAFTPEGIVR